MKDKITCIIIDDEAKARENIRLLIDTYCPKMTVIGEAWNPESIQEILQTQQPDVVFLDIQIGSKNIFEIIDAKTVSNFAVVFVTAYLDYALKGYSFRALDYLLKPIDPTKLVLLYSHLLERKVDTSPPPITFLNELKLLLQDKITEPKIKLSDTEGIHLVKVDDILYCKGEGAYTNFSLKDNSKKCISKNLRVFEEKLKPYQFFRINKSTLINLQAIQHYHKEDGGYVIMEDGSEFFLSRLQKKAFLQALNQLTIR